MRLRSLLVTVLSFLFFFSFCRISFADGFYLPEPHVKLPNIPVQRALLKYRDGVETLIVESTLDGPGQRFGWIIPVPSTPQRFEKITPGLLKTLSSALQPRITHHLTHSSSEAYGRSVFRFLFFVWAIFMFLSCLYILLKSSPSPRSVVKFDFLLVIVLLVGAFVLLGVLPMLLFGYRSSGPLPEPTSVRVESRQVVGEYEISVVTAGKSSDLNTWLRDNGFSQFPDKAVAVVDDYIAKQWAFVAAKIIREGQGTATPHPILIEFNTDRLVYPMRLTALSGSPVHLELFILAAKEAVAVGYELEKRYCDYFDYESSYSHYYRFAKENASLYLARANKDIRRFHDTIGHPIAMKLMWSGCVLTKLAGEVSNDQMKDDMFFLLKNAAPYRSHVYSSQWVIQRGFMAAIVIGLLGLQCLCVLYKTRERVSVTSFPALLILCVAIFCAIYFRFEKVEVTSQLTATDWSNLATEIYAFTADYQGMTSGLSDDEISTHVTSMKNILTNENVVIEDSPGNITWERKYGELFFSIYLPDGTPRICYPSFNYIRRENLIAALEDAAPEIRYKAAWALGNTRSLYAVDPLLAALEDEHWLVRITAASALWKTNKDSRALEFLIASLKDKDPKVRQRAIWELGSTNDHRVVTPLMTALEDKVCEVRWAAEKALGRMEHPKAVEALVFALDDENPRIRENALRALGYSKNPWAAQVVNNAKYEEVNARYQQVIELDPKNVTAYFNWGTELSNLKRYDDAMVKYRQAIRINPDDFRAYNNLAWILIDKDIDVNKGLKLALKANELHPNNGIIMDTIGWGFYKKGRYNLAVQWLYKAVELSPRNWEWQEHLDLAKSELIKQRNHGFSAPS